MLALSGMAQGLQMNKSTPPDGTLKGSEVTSWKLGAVARLFWVRSDSLLGFPGDSVVKNPPSVQEM